MFNSHPQRSSDDAVVIDIPDDETKLLGQTLPHVITSSTDGQRHKLLADRTLTSCGGEWHAGLDSIVPETTWMADAHCLCRDCFSGFERHKAEQTFVETKKRITGEQAPINMREWIDLPSRKPRKRK